MEIGEAGLFAPALVVDSVEGFVLVLLAVKGRCTCVEDVSGILLTDFNEP